MDIDKQFQAILDDRINRGLEPAGGNEEDSIGFLAQGKLRKKKTWHKGRFYHDMTDFYARDSRQRIWTKPTVELRKGMSKGGSMFLDGYSEGSSPLGSPGRSPTRGRLGRAGTGTLGGAPGSVNNSAQSKLATTDYNLPTVQEQVEVEPRGGIATYAGKKKA